MLGSIGLPELIFIMILALLIFGPKRLPEIGRTLGKGLTEFRRATNDLKRTIDSEILSVDDERRLPGPPLPAVIPTGPARTLAAESSATNAAPATSPAPAGLEAPSAEMPADPPPAT